MTDPDRHPEDYCHRCGGPNISWFTPGAVWDPVMRPIPGAPWKWQEIICPPCFVELATNGGAQGSWTLLPAKDDGETYTSADERAAVRAERDRARNVAAHLEAELAEERAQADYARRHDGQVTIDE
jgi:hypothetical protein